MQVSDEKGYPAILKINLPPEAEYHSGHSLILQGQDLGQIQLMLTAAEQITDPILKRIIDFAKGGAVPTPATAPALAESAVAPVGPTVPATAPVSPPVTLTVEQVAAMLGAQVAPQVVVGQAAAAAQAATPVAPAPVTPPAQAPQNRVDGSTCGGTPGQQYPAGSQMGGPCPKDSVITFWQPPGKNFQTGETFDGYWRCPNAKNHPKAA